MNLQEFKHFDSSTAAKELRQVVSNDLACDFMVVGSVALLMHGLPLLEKPHDIDIEILIPDLGDAEKSAAKRASVEQALMAMHDVSYHPGEDSEYPHSGNRYDFRLPCGMHVDAWVVMCYTHNALYKKGIAYACIDTLLKKKFEFKRNKDYAYRDLLIRELKRILPDE